MSSNGNISNNFNDLESDSVICTSLQTLHLSVHTSIALVETKIELDSIQIYVVSDNCLIVHDHNRPVNVNVYNPKAGLKHAHVFNATVAYIVPEMGHVVILSINHMIKMKGLDHCLLCPMQCHVNDVLINEDPTFLAPIPSKTTYGIHIENPINATHLVIIPMELN